MRRPVITLLTDFGLSGPYVAAMKGVILGINPQALIIDITHQVRPQAIEEGAFLLSTVVPFFPRRSIHLAVVDPAVGTERVALALQTHEALFVGPDNGLLSAALPDAARPVGLPAAQQAGGTADPIAVPLPAGVRAVRLTNRRYFRQEVSRTFHGRDIFAPVAAHLSRGVPLEELGEPAQEVLTFPAWRALPDSSGCITGRVISIDNFGNLITNIRGTDLPSSEVWVAIGGQRFEGLQQTFQEGPDFVVYIGSSGYLEVAQRNGDAAAALSVGLGQRLTVWPRS